MRACSIIISLLLLISCGTKVKSNHEHDNGSRNLLLELPLPVVPENLDSAEIAGYLLNHFWDGLDFTDTVKTYNRDFMEQNFANFAHLLLVANDSTARREGVGTLLKKAEEDPETYKLISEIAYHYLYDPNSPMLHEDSFIPFMEIYQDSELIDEAERERNRFLLHEALKNRQGMRAADFPYITRDGKTTSLYKTPVKGSLLLVFYDPDCDNCKEIIQGMAENPDLSAMIAQGEITLLAIYSGENKELWYNTSASLPGEWIVGYNSGTIEDNGDYFFRASPTIYLLDENKTVIVKDLSLNKDAQRFYP